MDNAARARQRVLAIFLPVTAVLYIGGEAVSPKGTDQVITATATALKVLPIAARHPAQLYFASWLVILGLGGLAVSNAAIAALVRNRGSALATVAALIGDSGPSAASRPRWSCWPSGSGRRLLFRRASHSRSRPPYPGSTIQRRLGQSRKTRRRCRRR